jgi:hypothetical protein
MMESDMGGVTGTRGNPWVLKTPGGAVQFVAFRDPAHAPPAIVVRVHGEEKRYHLRCLNDLDEMLKKHRDWIPLGSAGEQEPAADGSVEAWARSPKNPAKGWYGLTQESRGNFALFIPPIMQALSLAEIDDTLLRMRAI